MVRCSRASADFDLGFERAGIETIWQVEIDPYATKILAKHWPHVRRYSDITRIDWRTVPQPDILSGGFPCQDISHAGKRAGITGSQSGLWTEFRRAIVSLRPRYVVVENVAALYQRGLDTVLGDLAASGYDAEWDCLPAAAVGAPHLRERIFIVAYPTCGGLSQSDICSEQPRRTETISASKVMADPAKQRGFWGAVGTGQTESKRTYGWITRCSQWDIEPNVGRTLDGFSAWLDGFDITHSLVLISAHGKATQTRPQEVLRTMQRYLEAQADGRYASICSEAVLLAFVRQLANKTTDKAWVQLESQEASQNSVRSVPTIAYANRSSRRPGHLKQPSTQHSNPLQALSRLLALDAEKAWSTYRRSDASLVLGWEQGYARIAHSVPKRVDRLKCLGNAVVPQLTELIGRMIVAAEARR